MSEQSMKVFGSYARAQATTYATVHLTLELFTTLTSNLIKDLVTAPVTTSNSGDIHNGKRSKPTTTSSDANI